MIPVADTNHVAEGLALLTGMFKDATNINGLLKSFLGPVQDLDDMVFATITGRLLDNAVGDAMDKIGAIVGEARLGRSDADYKVAIVIRISVNDSQGKAEDLFKIATLAFGVGNFSYDEGTTASWELRVLNAHGFPFVAKDFHDAKAAGTRGVLITSTWDPSLDFVPGSVYGSVPNAKGFGSVYGSVPSAGILVTSFGV